MRRWFVWLGSSLGLLLLVVLATALYVAFASLPQKDGQIGVRGIDGPLAITRDSFGIPLIEAESMDDLYFGIGFAHAQDRLWQMEFARRAGQGRLAEILGSDALGIDRFMRTLGLYHVAEQNLKHLPQRSLSFLKAYSAGVNAFLESRTSLLPIEFQILFVDPEPWRPVDSILLVKLLALDLSKNWRDETKRHQLAGEFGPALLDVLWPLSGKHEFAATASLSHALPAANDGLGSNIWAISADSSPSGGALLANDPHLALQAPGTWYSVRLKAPGIRAIGGTIPALPVLVIGRNENISWGFTNSGADVQDLFLHEIDANNPDHYLSYAGAKAFESRMEMIRVRGEENEEWVVRSTQEGPVISDLPGNDVSNGRETVSLRWTALDPDDGTLTAGFDLLLAESWQDFQDAIRLFDAPPQNAVYADREGQVGMLLAGRVPIRKNGDGRYPINGSDADNSWQGYLPFERKPEILNPAAGWLANANNRIAKGQLGDLLTRDWDADDRFRRIVSALSKGGHGVDRAKRLQNDPTSILADDFLPLLLSVGSNDGVLAAMRQWDGLMTKEEPEPLIFQAWYRALFEAVFADDLKDQFKGFRGIRSDALRHVIHNRPEYCDDIRTDQIEDCRLQAEQALDEALTGLRKIHGNDWRTWKWGDASIVRMAHRPFSKIPLLNWMFDITIEKDGGPTSPNVSRFSQQTPYETVAAASMRMIVDWSDPEAVWIINATGQSGHPLSRHYKDQSLLWAEGQYLRLQLPDSQPKDHNALSDQFRLLLIPSGA